MVPTFSPYMFIYAIASSSLLKALILINLDAPSTIANTEVHYSLT